MSNCTVERESTSTGVDGNGAGQGALIHADERLLSCLFAAPEEAVEGKLNSLFQRAVVGI